MPLENRNDEKRRTTPTTIDSLPDDDLIMILVKLPAQDLHDTGRLVCRRWYHLIRSPEFIRTHLQSSPTGILMRLRSNYQMSSLLFMGMNRGRIETYKLHFKFAGTIWSSCNGLILLCDHFSQGLFVVNPATNQHFSIPLYRERIPRDWSTCLGYVAATMKYKVVHVNNKKECAILTVGVDDLWRPLPTDHISNSICDTVPLVTEGFVHWVAYDTGSLVTLNLETENICDIPLPESMGWRECFLAGKCLSFISVSQPGLCWEVWEMRPGPVVEWDKLTDIYLGDKVDTLEKLSPTGNCVLRPHGWIQYKEVFLYLLCGHCTFVAYNICTREYETFEPDFPFSSYHCVAHKNSLVCLDGSQV